MCLRPESQRRWGKMTLALVLAHCTSGFQMAVGTINPKRASFPANVIGPLIKPLVFGDDKPIRRNSPSSPELFLADPTQCEFERERAQLIKAIDSFVTTGAACALNTHILSLVRSNHNSGRFSCTNTSTITCDNSASNRLPSRRHMGNGPIPAKSHFRQLQFSVTRQSACIGPKQDR